MILAVAAGFPAMMILAEWKWRRSRDATFLTLVGRWQRASLAALGLAVISATLASVTLWNLWPEFMGWAHPVIGMPFSFEGAALALALLAMAAFAKGRDRLPPRLHATCGVLAALFAALPGVVFIDVNAWLNTPAGLTMVGGNITSVDLATAVWNAALPQQAAHFVVGAWTAVGLAIAGAPALAMLRRGITPRREATLAVALYLGAMGAIFEPAFGHLSARFVTRHQPAKFAAMDAVFFTEPLATLTVGGIPDESAGETRYAMQFPLVLSMLMYDDPFAEVTGLDEIEPRDRPPVRPVFFAFQVMALLGSFISIVASWVAWKWIRKQVVTQSRTLLWLLVVSAPMSVACLWAGWIASTIGREPWAIHGVTRTAQAWAAVHAPAPAMGAALLIVVVAGAALTLIGREVHLALEDA